MGEEDADDGQDSNAFIRAASGDVDVLPKRELLSRPRLACGIGANSGADRATVVAVPPRSCKADRIDKMRLLAQRCAKNAVPAATR